MRFQIWIQTAKDLMDMIKLIPVDYPEMIREYNSAPFSIRYNEINGCTTFKRSVGVEHTEPHAVSVGTHIHQVVSGNSTGSGPVGVTGGNVTITGPLIINAPLYNPHTNDEQLKVSLTVRDGELIDLKFINRNMNSFTFSTDISEDGGKIEHTMLYIGSDKMIYNGVLYDIDSPDPFTHDISTDTDVSIMDLFYLKEYYENNGRP